MKMRKKKHLPRVRTESYEDIIQRLRDMFGDKTIDLFMGIAQSTAFTKEAAYKAFSGVDQYLEATKYSAKDDTPRPAWGEGVYAS